MHYYSGRFEAYQRTYVVHKFSRPVRYVWHQLDYRLIESLGLGKIGTSIPYIKRENLAGFAFPVPATESEQRTIAGALSDADALIESLEQLIAKKPLTSIVDRNGKKRKVVVYARQGYLAARNDLND